MGKKELRAFKKALKGNYNETVGGRLRAWLDGNGYTRKNFLFAEMVGLSQGSLSDLRNGKSLPSSETLARFHVFAGLNVVWLLTGSGAETVG